jgi:hypothetical protein
MNSKTNLLELSPWRLREGVLAFRTPELLIDVLVAIAALCAGAVLFQVWRRRRRSLWRFSLFDLGAIVLMAGIAMGAVASNRRAAMRETAAWHRLDEESRSDPGFRGWPIARERGGPAWLRDKVFVNWFADFDRVQSAECAV